MKKVKPILIKKDKLPETVNLDVVETPIANHFEENPPKDEFELLRSNSVSSVFLANCSVKITVVNLS